MNIPVRATIIVFALALLAAGTSNEVLGQPTQSSAQADERAVLALVANFERVQGEQAQSFNKAV